MALFGVLARGSAPVSPAVAAEVNTSKSQKKTVRGIGVFRDFGPSGVQQ